MSMSMSSLFPSTKPSTCINLHKISLNSNIKQSSLGSKSRLFHHNPYIISFRQSQRHRKLTVGNSSEPIPPQTPSSPTPAGFPGKGWIAGAVVALLLPFLKNKWGPLFLLKKEVDQRLQTVEDVAEGLEKLADKVDHMAEDVGKNLPGGSSLRRVATLIEDAAERVELAARLTDSAIDKIQELEEQVESYAKAKQTEASEPTEEKNNYNNKPTS